MSLMSASARSTFLSEEAIKAGTRRTARQFRSALSVFQVDFDVHSARFYRNIGISVGLLDFVGFILWLSLLFTSILDKKTENFAEIQLLSIHFVVLMLGIVNLSQNLHWAIREQESCNVAAATVSSVLFGLIGAFIDLASVAKAFYLPKNYGMLYKAIVLVQIATSFIVILWAGSAYAWQAGHNAYCAKTSEKYERRRKAKAKATSNEDEEEEGLITTSS